MLLSVTKGTLIMDVKERNYQARGTWIFYADAGIWEKDESQHEYVWYTTLVLLKFGQNSSKNMLSWQFIGFTWWQDIFQPQRI